METNNQTTPSSTENTSSWPTLLKKEFPRWIFILVIILLLVVIAIFAYQNTLLKQQINSSKTTSSPSSSTIEPLIVPSPTPIQDLTSDWETYTDDSFGFTFKYPNDIEIFTDYRTASLKQDTLLVVNAELISQIGEDHMGYDQTTSQQDQVSLQNKQYGNKVDWSIKESEEIVNIGGVNGKSFVVLSRFDVCDVTFSRIAVLYKNDSRIILGLEIPRDTIINDSPQYFEKNETECGDMQMWKSDKSLNFYEDLINKKTGPLSVKEYQIFDEILSTFQFID